MLHCGCPKWDAYCFEDIKHKVGYCGKSAELPGKDGGCSLQVPNYCRGVICLCAYQLAWQIALQEPQERVHNGSKE